MALTYRGKNVYECVKCTYMWLICRNTGSGLMQTSLVLYLDSQLANKCSVAVVVVVTVLVVNFFKAPSPGLGIPLS